MDGAVLGLHDGVLMEYDSATLAPLGLVADKEQLHGREVVVVGGNNGREQALVLMDSSSGEWEIVHPNDDGSYWRRRQRNKSIRLREKRREQVVKAWAASQNSNK